MSESTTSQEERQVPQAQGGQVQGRHKRLRCSDEETEALRLTSPSLRHEIDVPGSRAQQGHQCQQQRLT